MAVAEQRVVSRSLMELEESDTLIELLNRATALCWRKHLLKLKSSFSSYA